MTYRNPVIPGLHPVSSVCRVGNSVCRGFEVDGGATQTLARLAGGYLPTEVTGGFLGRMVGMYGVGGEADFDWFGYAAA